jgi:membrane protease YdiL (CAAX protease family)
LAIGEIALVFTVVVVLPLPGKPFRHWQLDRFGYTFLTNLLFFFTPPLLIWALTRRSPSNFGLAFGELKSQARIGWIGGLMLLAVASWPIGVIELLGTTYREWLGSIILVCVEVIALIVVIRTIRSKPDPAAGNGSHRHVVLFMLAVMLALVLGAGSFRFSKLAAGLVYKFVFVGFGEELFFRGYVQSRLNTAFGRPFRLFGIQWGLGLIVASVLFGLMHPLVHSAPRPWPWALWTAVAGMIFGMLREKSGSIIAPAIAHGLFVTPMVLLEALSLWEL